MKNRPVGTRSFIAFWWLYWLGIGVANSWIVEHSPALAAEAWVFHMFNWAAVVFCALLGNHMATGSIFLRGLRDWP